MEYENWLYEICLNIAALRKNQGYTQETFAKKLGIKQSALARIEAGQNLKCSTLWQISEVLGIDLTIFDASTFAEKEKFSKFCENSNEVQCLTNSTEEKGNFIDIEYTKFNLNNLFKYGPRTNSTSC